MIKIFKTFGGYIEIPKVEKGCWINVTQPTKEEIQRISEEFNITADTVLDILDVDERPRVEFDDTSNNSVPFHTVPLGIYMSDDFTLTLCLQDNEILPIEQVSPFREQLHQIPDVINFILRLFVRNGNTFLRYLKEINQQTSVIEKDLEESIKNSELNKLLKMEKCLVYFITSIKANEIVLAKLHHSKKIVGEINEDMFEDAKIENKQALEMAQIYSDILSGMMDAFASIISNNLNIVMKQLTLISILLMIPTLIASIFGMNVPNFIEDSHWAMPSIIIVSLFISVIGVFLFRKRRWF